MSSKDTPSRPIPIQRERSASLDSAGSNQVPALSASSSQSQSPPLSPSLPKQGVPASPILSYFFNKDGSPTSPNALKTGTSLSATIMEKDPNSGKPKLSPVLGHHRALSMNSDWPRFPSQQSPVSKPVNERGVGILRRLSISGTPFQRPVIPSNGASQDENPLQRSQTIGTTAATLPRSRPHGRRATLSPGDMPKPRAPSPIGRSIYQ
ncbi:hypothetical protein FS842_001113 [Serendipita sp. 407]|nr:hypothetical protein FRC18_008456 [Serendipita sp. 400]KAG9045741.1 hypothetical protein FS842_001113 [Serendipita sp. 407]